VTPIGAAALPLALVGFAAAALVAFVLTPVAGRIAVATGAIDLPGAARRIHAVPIPRAGGLAVAAAFVAVGGLVLWYNAGASVVPPVFVPPERELVALFAGGLAAVLLGFLDDRYDLQARWQFLGQLALAAAVIAGGSTIEFVNNPFGSGVIRFTGAFAAGFTGFWVVGMINSINFVDGLDGLSSGIAMIAALTLGGISLQASQNEPVVAILCFVLAGSLAGFLPWNFHPARIFVGTTGVFLMGYTLAVLSILGTAKVAVALLVLGVPIIDTFWIIVRRAAHGQAPFTADRGHLHHRLLDLGLGHREAVILIYGMCTMLAILSFALSGSGQVYAFLGIVVAGGVVLYLLTRHTGEALEASSYDPPQGISFPDPDALERTAHDRDV
jgi:UDP-GlcNAc:undecaprenyl-phosphate GlcNAc-1-phosphate transferase